MLICGKKILMIKDQYSVNWNEAVEIYKLLILKNQVNVQLLHEINQIKK